MPSSTNLAGRRYVRNKALAEYLNTTAMSIWRWKRDPRLNFPPSTVINGIEYNDIDAIDDWMRARVVDHTEAKTHHNHPHRASRTKGA